jgi:hypothetical protein
MSYPSTENEFDRSAALMKNPNTLDKAWRGVGKKKGVRAEKVTIKDSNTGKTYGTRTIMQKTTESTSFIEYLITEGAADITVLPERIIKEIRKNIRGGAADLEQQWKNALELVNTAFKVSNIRLPLPDQKGAWKQYEDLIQYGVKQMHELRGIDGDWRITRSSLRENAIQSSLSQQEMGDIGNHRIFATIPGVGQQELHAKDFDEVIDQLENHLRHKGAKLRVDSRSADAMDLSVYVKADGEWVKREEIKVRDYS